MENYENWSVIRNQDVATYCPYWSILWFIWYINLSMFYLQLSRYKTFDCFKSDWNKQYGISGTPTENLEGQSKSNIFLNYKYHQFFFSSFGFWFYREQHCAILFYNIAGFCRKFTCKNLPLNLFISWLHCMVYFLTDVSQSFTNLETIAE